MGMDEKKENNSETPAKSELLVLVERQEKANAESKELLKRQEELIARGLLGGKTDAGIQPEPPKEETPQEYAARISSGKI